MDRKDGRGAATYVLFTVAIRGRSSCDAELSAWRKSGSFGTAIPCSITAPHRMSQSEFDDVLDTAALVPARR